MIYSSAQISVPNMKATSQIVIEIAYTQDFQSLFSKGHNSEKGYSLDMTKIGVNYFFMRNLFKKSQNPSSLLKFQISPKSEIIAQNSVILSKFEAKFSKLIR